MHTGDINCPKPSPGRATSKDREGLGKAWSAGDLGSRALSWSLPDIGESPLVDSLGNC